ncbi:hypothetical protein M501DRAFT_995883 [Patellaria atrata CBS 101060]|uniref:Uncharacterized protein n=1 Tax=Patellaria atrata CBS 101060 TaxID=1346257 RepID=A0A9P4VN31_9PEZI|nr:hypothetical protein M501DRAFT_995883 [Patellaria atrata CBS 101060]
MRLFLLPISTRRALIYSERIPQRPDAKLSIVDRVINKSSETWARWEKEEGGWKRWVTRKGESIFKRIPYEEWGLKSIPALSERRKIALKEGKENAEVLFPGLFLNEAKVPEILRQLAQERQSLHRKRLIWSIVGMPISAPFALVPMYESLDRVWKLQFANTAAEYLIFPSSI